MTAEQSQKNIDLKAFLFVTVYVYFSDEAANLRNLLLC